MEKENNYEETSFPKRSNEEILKKVSNILKENPDLPRYDRPEDDGQVLLAHKTPGSEIQAKKHHGKPSWERYSGD